MVPILEHIVQSHHNSCLFSIHSSQQASHIPLKYRCPITKSDHMRSPYLRRMLQKSHPTGYFMVARTGAPRGAPLSLHLPNLRHCSLCWKHSDTIHLPNINSTHHDVSAAIIEEVNMSSLIHGLYWINTRCNCHPPSLHKGLYNWVVHLETKIRLVIESKLLKPWGKLNHHSQHNFLQY